MDLKHLLVTTTIVIGFILFAVVCGMLGWFVAGVIHAFIPWVYTIMWQMAFIWLGLSSMCRLFDKLEQMESRRKS